MLIKHWNLLTIQEAKEQLLKLLESPHFIDNIIFEPELDLDGNPERVTFTLPEESCKRVALALNIDGSSCGSFISEDIALSAIKAVILTEVDDFAAWLISNKDFKILNGTLDQEAAYLFINENQKLNKYKTNKFVVRFDRDINKKSTYGFLVTSIRPVKP